jgi:hypothetical protein
MGTIAYFFESKRLATLSIGRIRSALEDAACRTFRDGTKWSANQIKKP